MDCLGTRLDQIRCTYTDLLVMRVLAMFLRAKVPVHVIRFHLTAVGKQLELAKLLAERFYRAADLRMAYKFPMDRAIIVPVTKLHRMLLSGAIVFSTFLPGTARLATLLIQTCVLVFDTLFLATLQR